MISWEVDLIAVAVIIVTCVIAWVKMQQTIQSNHELANNEFKHMVKTIEDLNKLTSVQCLSIWKNKYHY